MALRLSTPLFIADRVRTSWTYKHPRYSGGVRFSVPRFMVTKRTFLSTKFRRPASVTKWGNPQHTLPSKLAEQPADSAAGPARSQGAKGGEAAEKLQGASEKAHAPKFCDMLYLHQEDQKRKIRPHANFFFR
ncbi:hypothetical protein BESB_081910 [Besnoitia besnoiti]|uniref:Uncharacterized protein n=1 Tax=Besnoitia besnoiti TaxID=94643 RepID=A0A2A9MC74_BESBE|nr:hypothetical protein BESB_081910 [Besnoitia besnoiti]PFH32992.1 hypothetical protein BESB_081910 [Besnoitia besnoiti]